jgi:class 3 adenylate cyclase/tetratricopeptide (TPR) repeat protein
MRVKVKCKKCDTENSPRRKFCRECGAKLIQICTKCASENLPEDKFCGECGEKLKKETELKKPKPVIEELKPVTILFSDLCGYTAISEKLDPEEMKKIISRIFGEVAQIVTKYEGHIDKFIGDAVMAIFGIPKVHEDDPVRAIKSAMEIHDLVGRVSPQLEERIGMPLSMHSGINTGLVITDELNLERGTERVLGETVNLASRLTNLAGKGEIFVSEETYRQSKNHFDFEMLKSFQVKSKEKPIQPYKVLSPKKKPITVHSLSDLKAELIGRKRELDQLREAFQQVQKGRRRIVSICGDAGTGKSRLIEEFKSTLNLNKIQWREGHAYAFSQNIPYFPLIDIFNRAWQIEEDDSPEIVKKKVESNIYRLLGKKENFASYIGYLYGLSYPDVEKVSPEYWKSQLFEIVKKIIASLTQMGTTVIFLEDIHWADPSSLDLLRFVLLDSKYPALFLCVYRPPFTLFTSQELHSLGNSYQEIVLKELSPSEAEAMTASLLKAKNIPLKLKNFIHEKAEGNPYYLEEMIHSLIESGILVHDNGNCRLEREISEIDIPLTIKGLISARIDRLKMEMKRILQEASVIGRVFSYETLKKITEFNEQLDRCLHNLEGLDLIKVRSLKPEPEYVFKHNLIQEVVYNSLPKKEHQKIHKKIALLIEKQFHNRLQDFYETLAFHFKKSNSLHKAINYLMKSGERSLKRYSVEESHQYYNEAFKLLVQKRDKTQEEKKLLIDILSNWTIVFYYRGDFKGLENVLRTQEGLVKSLNDKIRRGMFYISLSMASWGQEKLADSYYYLQKALKLGEETKNNYLIAYACTRLIWTCVEMTLVNEAIFYGERALKILQSLETSPFLYPMALLGLGYTHFIKGERGKIYEIGKTLLDFGQKHSHIRSLVFAHWTFGNGHFVDGNMTSAIENYKKALQISTDPWLSQFPRLLLGLSYVYTKEFHKAEGPLREVLDFSEKFGAKIQGTPAWALLGAISIAKGQMNQGISMLYDAQRLWIKNKCRWRYIHSEYTLGNLYLEISKKSLSTNFFTLTKNIGFLVKNVPLASKRAEAHFNKAIEAAKEIGANGMLGRTYLDLASLYTIKGRKEKAKRCISEAIQCFEQCEIKTLLKQAWKSLASLESGS